MSSRFTSAALSTTDATTLIEPRLRIRENGDVYSVYEPFLPLAVIPIAGVGFVAGQLSAYPYVAIISVLSGFLLFACGVYLLKLPPGIQNKRRLSGVFGTIFIVLAAVALIFAEIYLFGKAINESGAYVGAFSSDKMCIRSAVSSFPIIACALAIAIVYLLSGQQNLKGKYALLSIIAFVPASYAIWYAAPFTRDVFYLAPFLAACWFALKDDKRSSWFWAGAFFSAVVAIKLSNILLISGFVLLAIHRASILTAGHKEKITHCFRRVSILFLLPVTAIVANIVYNFYIFGTVNSYWLTPMQTIDSVFIGLFGFFFSPGKSIFIYAPVVVLLIFFWKYLPRRTLPMQYLLAGCAIPWILFHASLAYWHGEGSWGPRYLLPLVPLAVILAISTLHKSGTRRKILVALLLIVGFIINLPAIITPPHFKGDTVLALFDKTPGDISSEVHIYHPLYFFPVIGWRNIYGDLTGKSTLEISRGYALNKTFYTRENTIKTGVPVVGITRAAWPKSKDDIWAVTRLIMLLFVVVFFGFLYYYIFKRYGVEETTEDDR